MMIRFKCANCAHRLKAREQFVGRLVRCTRCGTDMRVPPAEQSLVHRSIRRVGEAESEPGAVKLTFVCVGCGKSLGPEARIGGRWAKCPTCAKIVDIPTEVLASISSQALPTARPARSQESSSEIEVPGEAEGDAPTLRKVPGVADGFLDRFLPPHHEALPELKEYDVPELKLAEGEEDYAQPAVEGHYGFRLALKVERRRLYVAVIALFILYAGANGFGAWRRIQAAGQLAYTGEVPLWMESLTPRPPQLTPKGEIVRVGHRVPPAWVAAMGVALGILAVLQLVGVWMLWTRRDPAARWVFLVGIAAILIELLDLSVTGTGFMSIFKPVWWGVSILAVCGVVSK
jgi:DNA-directed RNA polymerase subunit RPC12/RpoP